MAVWDAPRVAVVTGGTAGVGRAVARALADVGADVAVIARDRGRLESAVRDIESRGRRAFGVSADVADASAIEHAAEEIERELGAIDCWVNNAMTSVFAPAMEVAADEFRRVTEVTYLGVVYGTQAAMRRMGARDRGIIIQVGSALAYRGIPLQAAYCGAKHAIVGFTESLRTELLHDKSGVRITMVHLPAMNTPQFEWVLSRLDRRPQPVPPIFAPEVAARAVVWASRRSKREVFVGFPTYKTVWGNRLAPWLADWKLARDGYSSQQTDESEDPDRPANLWAAVEGDFAAHGRFGDRSRERSLWTIAMRHRWALWAALLLLGLGVAGSVAALVRAL